MIKLTKYIELILSLFRILSENKEIKGKINVIIRIIWWKTNQILFHLPTLVTFNEGFKCICYPNSSYAGLIIYKQYPEKEELEYVHKTLSEKDVFIDVGANIGLVSLIASSKIKKGKIYSFEPSDIPRRTFQENIRLNNIKNIYLFDEVVSNKIGNIYFSRESACEIDHIAFLNRDGLGIVRKKSVTIDQFVKQNKLNNVDLLKIDVEGAEKYVFEGMINSLRNKIIKKIVFEVNPKCVNYGYQTSYTPELLKHYGYKIYELSKGGKTKHWRDCQILSTINLVAVCN